MTTIETIKAIKDYGTIAICVIALVWMNSQISDQKKDIKEIQGILYDCFEERIKENLRPVSFNTDAKTVSIFPVKTVFILPEETKIKRA